MLELWLLTVLVVGFVALWIVGEVRDVRLLRLTGILVPCLGIPLAYGLGEVVAHGRAMTANAVAIAEFGRRASERLDDGNAELVQAEIRQLGQVARSCTENYESVRAKPAVGRLHVVFEDAILQLGLRHSTPRQSLP